MTRKTYARAQRQAYIYDFNIILFRLFFVVWPGLTISSFASPLYRSRRTLTIVVIILLGIINIVILTCTAMVYDRVWPYEICHISTRRIIYSQQQELRETYETAL